MADLKELAEAHLTIARKNERGCSAELIAQDGELRQAIIALTEGTRLPEHNAHLARPAPGLPITQYPRTHPDRADQPFIPEHLPGS